MSLDTWKAEFHVDLPRRATRLQMLRAAERKYVGGRAANLTRHGVITRGGSIQDTLEDPERPYCFAFECALCERHVHGCESCPLYEVRRAACDAALGGPEQVSPWASWELDGDPEPMLALIRKAIRWDRERQKHRRLARRAAK